MSMFTLRRSQKQSGFTLMELLIVIAVLGLLLGMLIPRLAGITDDTVDTVCDTNNKGTRYLTQMYINKYNTWPDNLTNLVNMKNDTSATAEGDDGFVSGSYEASFTSGYTLSLQYDNQPEAQELAAEFWTRNVPGVFALNADEIAELRDMGITSLYNKIGSDGRTMQKEPIATGTYVMMMGAAASTDTAFDVTFRSQYPVGNPEWLGRIMLAVNDKCDLVKKGILQASALCPGAVLAEEDFSHKEYILVLPRLEATVERTGAAAFVDADAIYFVAGTDGDSTTGQVIDFVFEAQSSWEFDMSCPEGHKWPDNDDDTFVFLTAESDGYTNTLEWPSSASTLISYAYDGEDYTPAP